MKSVAKKIFINKKFELLYFFLTGEKGINKPSKFYKKFAFY